MPIKFIHVVKSLLPAEVAKYKLTSSSVQRTSSGKTEESIVMSLWRMISPSIEAGKFAALLTGAQLM